MVREQTRGRLARATRIGSCAVWTVALALQVGCYSYRPVQSAPPTDGYAAIVLNDRGRTLLADRVGPLMDRLEGRIVQRQGSELRMAVYRVVDVRGNSSTWTGDTVSVPEEAVLGYRPRAFSKFKTALLVGAGVLAIVWTLGKSLNVFGDPASERPGEGGPQQS